MKILDRLPIPDEHASLRFGNRYITLHHDQILVWISVSLGGVHELDDKAPRFPALLDTGNNFDFSLREQQLRDWAGIDPRLLVILGEIEINGQAVSRRRATVWLHPNMPNSVEMAMDKSPFLLDMAKGIAVHPDDRASPGPRLPLPGLPAFLKNDLDLWLDPDRRHITVRSRDWRRPLIRLLRRL